jgi:Flp pilus assembly protein TadD
MAQTIPARALAAVMASAWLAVACATTHGGERAGVEPTRPAGDAVSAAQPETAPEDSFEAAIGKTRHLSQRARPVEKSIAGPTIEDTDPRLAAALLTLATVPGAASERQVADEYRRLGILDAAYDHYRRATAINSRDGAAYDGLARVWRDWGLPGLGLGDARRAVFFAPRSAEAQNTLGTLLQALGLRKAAREAYQRALALDQRAAYAWSNLCYLSILDRKPGRAVSECRQALVLDQHFIPARHNLALGYAALGRQDLARAELLRAAPESVAYYNLGIISAARGDYASAAAAFQAACDARPWLDAACARALQFRFRAGRPEGENHP